MSTYRKGGGKVLHCFLIWDYPEEVDMLVLDVLQVTLHHSESSCVVATTMRHHRATCCYLPLIGRSVVCCDTQATAAVTFVYLIMKTCYTLLISTSGCQHAYHCE